MLVDSHCHLDCFENLDEILEAANLVGVEYFLSVCASLTEFAKILQIAEKYKNIYRYKKLYHSDSFMYAMR